MAVSTMKRPIGLLTDPSLAGASSALRQHPLFLPRLGMTLRRILKPHEEALPAKERYLQILENGEGLEPASKVRAAQAECQALKELVRSLAHMAEAATEGQLLLAKGMAVVCLQSLDGESSSIVIALPWAMTTELAQALSQKMVGGARLLMFPREEIEPLVTSEVGTTVEVSWDVAKYTVREVMRG